MSDEERESESRAVERLTLFSDAVVAIAITLLALELPVPEGDTVSAFWASVRRNEGHYAAFLISFFVIAGAWVDHRPDRHPGPGHAVHRAVRQGSHPAGLLVLADLQEDQPRAQRRVGVAIFAAGISRVVLDEQV